MRAAYALLGCAVGLSGCGVMESMSFDAERRLDPTAIYIASFEKVETTRMEADQFRCLSGAPMMCDVLAISLVECRCPY